MLGASLVNPHPNQILHLLNYSVCLFPGLWLGRMSLSNREHGILSQHETKSLNQFQNMDDFPFMTHCNNSSQQQDLKMTWAKSEEKLRVSLHSPLPWDTAPYKEIPKFTPASSHLQTLLSLSQSAWQLLQAQGRLQLEISDRIWLKGQTKMNWHLDLNLKPNLFIDTWSSSLMGNGKNQRLLQIWKTSRNWRSSWGLY